MNGKCPLCGVVARLEVHHVTGRVLRKPIHGSFVARLCGECNRAQYLLWQVARLDDELPSVEVLLRRTALWLDISNRALDQDEVKVLVNVLTDLAERMAA